MSTPSAARNAFTVWPPFPATWSVPFFLMLYCLAISDQLMAVSSGHDWMSTRSCSKFPSRLANAGVCDRFFLWGGDSWVLLTASSVVSNAWASLCCCLALYDCLDVRWELQMSPAIWFSVSCLNFLCWSLFNFFFSTGDIFLWRPVSGNKTRISLKDFPKFSLHRSLKVE